MPRAAKKPCAQPGCGHLVDDGNWCKMHRRAKRKTEDAGRPSAAKRGYGRAWQRARAGFLRKHPLCRPCEGRGVITAATVVDHIIPHKGDQKVFWDRKNWQPMCKDCHDRKTATEDGGFGRPAKG